MLIEGVSRGVSWQVQRDLRAKPGVLSPRSYRRLAASTTLPLIGAFFVWSEQISCPDCATRVPTHRHVWSKT